MSFSTFELPIRKLIKLVLIVGSVGALVGLVIWNLIAWQIGMYQVDAMAILGNALWVFHAANPLIFLVYTILVGGTTAIFWLDRKHQKTERQKQAQQMIYQMQREGNQ